MQSKGSNINKFIHTSQAKFLAVLNIYPWMSHPINCQSPYAASKAGADSFY